MKHYIIAKYKAEVTTEDKQIMAPKILELFQHTQEIPGIHDVNVYQNCVDRDTRYDIMIEMDMDREALGAYDASKWHKQWKEEYGCLLEKKAIFDRA